MSVEGSFGISGGVPDDSLDLPNFIQFLQDGSPLGGRDATKLNFRNNLTATRGTGENADTVTVDAAGGGGGGGSLPVPWMGMFQTNAGTINFNNETQFNGWDNISQFLASPDFELVAGPQVNILTAGVYEVRVSASVAPDFDSGWPDTDTVLGTFVTNAQDNYPTQMTSGTKGIGFQQYRPRRWVDTFTVFVNAGSLPFKLDPYLCVSTYNDGTMHGPGSLAVTARRIGSNVP
jgi:hypothetical protein